MTKECVFCRQRGETVGDIVHTTGYAFDHVTYREFIGPCDGTYDVREAGEDEDVDAEWCDII